ncbi:aberrant lateral root formation 4 [Striga asiatica]|uniref:Aberrant lateral root formation 4 n=1 Tax=Striga asiatica TaxID=4170 RepID=A0A5A7P4V6_STRAF|nr:aberrant lateral root formation 4 [Striga asiatica]
MLDDTSALVATLHENLACCSKLIEASDYSNSEQSIAELVDFLNSISNSLISEGRENDASESIAIEILTQIHQYVASPEDIVDALAFELPKAAMRFACVSTRCSEVAEGIVDIFVSRCSPRDMLSIICEAIGSPSEHFMVPGYFIPLLNGLMKVLALIQRRHYEHVKTTVPVVLNVLRIICSKPDYDDTGYEKLFHKAVGIACSIRALCAKLEEGDNKKLNALLGLYVLEIMVLVSVGMSSDISRCLPVVLELSDSLQYCELSYIGLITGFEVDTIYKLVVGEITDDTVDAMDCFSQVKLGAALAVMWGYKASKVAAAARADLAAVTVELQSNWRRRWEAIEDGDVDYSMHIPTFCTSLQAIQMVIMSAPGSVLRKNSFSAFKKVLADIPTSTRLDILRALIKNSDSPSMIGILLNCVKDEMHMGKFERGLSTNAVPNIDVTRSTLFWNPSVLELVEEVLRPPEGGPPPFPEYSDAVKFSLPFSLSACVQLQYIPMDLSLLVFHWYILPLPYARIDIPEVLFYRPLISSDIFSLQSQQARNSNYTGILSKENLHKAYNEWLLPLRTLVTLSAAESQKDHDDQLACDMMCALNPIQLVLYRCIELVEENLKKL